MKIQSEQEIREILDEYSIPYRNWNPTNGRSLERLVRSIRTGETFLTVEKINREMRVVRNVNVAVVTVRYQDKIGVWHELHEDFKMYSDGTIEVREGLADAKNNFQLFDGSVGEKIEVALGENAETAARRGLAQELGGEGDTENLGTYALGFRDPEAYMMEPWRGLQTLGPTDSDWCPQMLGRYLRHHMLCVIANNLYLPEYIEHQRGRYTIFSWKKL